MSHQDDRKFGKTSEVQLMTNAFNEAEGGISCSQAQGLLKTSGDPWSPEAKRLGVDILNNFKKTLFGEALRIAGCESVQQVSEKHIEAACRNLLSCENGSKKAWAWSTLGSALFGAAVPIVITMVATQQFSTFLVIAGFICASLGIALVMSNGRG